MVTTRRVVCVVLAVLTSFGAVWLSAAGAASAMPADPPGAPWGPDGPAVTVAHTTGAPVWQFLLVAGAAALCIGAVFFLVGHLRPARLAPPELIEVHEIVEHMSRS